MPQASSITVNDRATTPVAQTFTPAGIQAENASFMRSAATLMGRAMFQLRSRKSGARYYKRVLFTVPVVADETVNGISVPKVVRMGLVDATFRFDETSTLQERKDMVGMFANSLAPTQTMVDAFLTAGEEIW